MPKMVKLTDFLTEAQLQRAIDLYAMCGAGTFARLYAEEVIEPNIVEINRKLGQENDARFLAYMVESVLIRVQSGEEV